MMRKRKPLAFGAALVLLVTIILTVLVVLKPLSPHTQIPASTASSPTPATNQVIHMPLPDSNVTFLQNHMDSPNVTAQSLAWVPGLWADYVISATNPLPAGTKLVIDASTFWYIKDYGEVQGTVGNMTYIIHLERFGGQWFIAWTTEK